MTSKTRKPCLAFGRWACRSPLVPDLPSPHWTFLTRHAHVLLCIADDPGIRLRDLGDQVGITERAAHRIVGELIADGYLARERQGRRNHYTLRTQLPLPDRVARDQKVGDLLAVLTSRATSSG
jgi:predicted ArsR family transcriptional regulator